MPNSNTNKEQRTAAWIPNAASAGYRGVQSGLSSAASAVGSFFGGGDDQPFVRNTVGYGGKPIIPGSTPHFAADRQAPKATPTVGAGSGTGGGLPAKPLTHRATGGGGWGMLAGGATPWGTSLKANQRQGIAQPGSRSTLNSKPRVSQPMGAAPANQQAAVDRSLAGPRSAEATTADPHNWAGIARDLGNAGSPGFSKYKTGGYASSAAQAYVKKSNQSSVEMLPGMSRLSAPPKKPTPLRGPR